MLLDSRTVRFVSRLMIGDEVHRGYSWNLRLGIIDGASVSATVAERAKHQEPKLIFTEVYAKRGP